MARPIGAWSFASATPCGDPRAGSGAVVHALLHHLEQVGFDGAPRYHGEDENGREVLSYIDGDVPIAPHPAWALTDDALVSVARCCVATTRPCDPSTRTRTRGRRRCRRPIGARWSATTTRTSTTSSSATAWPSRLIDFDLASPGSAVWDVALAARLWVPLRDPRRRPRATSPRRAGHRLRLFADAYGLPEASARDGLGRARHPHLVLRHRPAGAEQGRPGYQHYWTPSAQEHDARGRRWLEGNLDR